MSQENPMLNVIDLIIDARDKARMASTRVGKSYFPTTQNELDELIRLYPTREAYFREHAIIIEPMIPTEHDVLKERMLGRYEPKEAAGLNRSDRRSLRKRKTR